MLCTLRLLFAVALITTGNGGAGEGFRQEPRGSPNGRLPQLRRLHPVHKVVIFGYDVTHDTWTLHEKKVPIFPPTRVPDNKVWHVTAAPLSTYGVTMFVKYYAADPPRAWVYLYRHSDTKPAQREENE